MKTLESQQWTCATERDVVRLILHNEKFLAEFAADLSLNLFRDKFQPVVKSALRYWQQYGKSIPLETLGQDLVFEMGSGLSEEKRELLFRELDHIFNQPVSEEYVTDQIRKFIKFKTVENATIAALEKIDEAGKDHDPVKISEALGFIRTAERKTVLQILNRRGKLHRREWSAPCVRQPAGGGGEHSHDLRSQRWVGWQQRFHQLQQSGIAANLCWKSV